MRRWKIWLMVYTPALVWAGLSLKEATWWIENIVAYPSLFLIVYLVLALVCALMQKWAHSAVCVVLAGAFALMTPKSEQKLVAQCANPVSVAQFNLYYENPDVNAFINYLLTKPADLIVMQEVAPEVGDKLQMLNDIYPYFYGGQEGVGYPSSQMILSVSPLKNMSVFMTPDEQNIIRGTWYPNRQGAITLIVAHPPSPRTKTLWYRRNALIQTIESLLEVYPSDEVMVVGDFNLSSTSLRFAKMFPTFQKAPVASWPNWAEAFKTPPISMIAIDHLWLQSVSAGRKICQRYSSPIPAGSDHLLVKTKIGY
ncbi:endonuclease/exonuclease/phosphatase family protein [Vibrio sp. Isolate25]|nr:MULTISPECIES: endonuclease/exonuclease/phosphatase family protein [Vibrio]MCG9596088.1 endonuclease/exonuclease/phosphatase family protein [Vibrio sp. Isolate25]MCG9677583.1 endonuclease/exonuclease/phosphatase family protein [Vibrio sp. Isolate24]USD35389.1 endonuclease/exonuclease/phosphatase family protein [Vibrio sp. SCSIO 43186]USD48457.1 endonuclease/exonuclease/phosphatase family protein [Vibrio sp. SCSIO 43145]USD72513.1 endonuclease/exonuclease/phosphatase family protein [Vibrio sp